MAFNRYHKKESVVSLLILLPYVTFISWMVYGNCIFTSVLLFSKSFLYNTAYFFFHYFAFGSVALFIRKRIPTASHLFKRIAVMLPSFYILTIFSTLGLFYLAKGLKVITCPVQLDNLWWTIVFGWIMNTLVTFINEGVANWEKWKSSLAETQRLKNAYRRSRLLGLKGQINPHFLFNCFNALSGLIAEDEKKAERFLEEMVKVHRYLLRNDNDYLVCLEDEIQFVHAYLYLAEIRYGSALKTLVEIHQDALMKLVPPLSLHVILENIIYSNAISKNNPLAITITSTKDQRVVITHSLHEKRFTQTLDISTGLDNLFTKYELLNAPPVRIEADSFQRTILLPILGKPAISI